MTVLYAHLFKIWFGLFRPNLIGVEVLLQFRRQQVVEPGRLVRSLLADQHQDDVVHHALVHPCRHHRHQPLLQVQVEEFLLLISALHPHRLRQFADVVAPLAIRRGSEVVQILTERMKLPDKVTLNDAVDVLHVHTLHFRHILPQRVNLRVADGHPCSVRFVI